jgi:hypothetical protein
MNRKFLPQGHMVKKEYYLKRMHCLTQSEENTRFIVKEHMLIASQ